MQKFLNTIITTDSVIGFSIARLTLGLVLFPHGAQKLLGLFGGYGYSSTMDFFTTQMGLPGIIAFSIIMIESIGSISLVLGFFSRVWALSLIGVSEHEAGGRPGLPHPTRDRRKREQERPCPAEPADEDRGQDQSSPKCTQSRSEDAVDGSAHRQTL